MVEGITTTTITIIVWWTEGVGKGELRHCRLWRSGVGEKETHNENVVGKIMICGEKGITENVKEKGLTESVICEEKGKGDNGEKGITLVGKGVLWRG